MTWNLNETKELIKAIFGRDQLELAAPSLNSLARRQAFADYHYDEATTIFEERLASFNSSPSPFAAFMKEALEGDHAKRIAVEAHVLACLHSLHALVDTFGIEGQVLPFASNARLDLGLPDHSDSLCRRPALPTPQ